MKISIRWALILGCLGLIWGTQVLITTPTYLSWQRVLLGHARDIMQNITDLTMEQSQNHLALAQGAAHLTERLITSEVVGSDLTHTHMLEHYFLDQLAIYDHFAGIYVGFPNGDFLYVSRSKKYAPNGYRTKIIRHVEGRRETRLVWRDAAFGKVAEESDVAIGVAAIRPQLLLVNIGAKPRTGPFTWGDDSAGWKDHPVVGI